MKPVDLTPDSDETLSAALDGELNSDLSAQVLANPANSERLATFKEITSKVGKQVDPLEDPDAQRLIDQALMAEVVTMSPRARRGPAPQLVAAAVVALVAIGLGLVWSGRDSNNDVQTAQSAERETSQSDEIFGGHGSSEKSGSQGPAAESGDESTAGVTTDGATANADPGPVVDLGTFTNADALREALAVSFPAELSLTSKSAGAAPAQSQIDRCAKQLEVTLKIAGTSTNVGYSLVGDQSVLVYEFQIDSYKDATPTTLVAAVGADACNQVAIFER
ncbi:MAG: hypothetical protein KDA95_03485 [Acidimicrobiales bacterium]|nr:hypothetical protein [Acidimicrobiales bacterium]